MRRIVSNLIRGMKMKILQFLLIGLFGFLYLQNNCHNSETNISSSNINNQNIVATSTNINSVTTSTLRVTIPTNVMPSGQNAESKTDVLYSVSQKSNELLKRCKHTPVERIIATPIKGIAPLTVTFDGSNSYDPNGTKIVRWQWGINNNNGKLIEGRRIEYKFTESGTYAVLLTITNQLGEKNTDCGHQQLINIVVSES